VVGWCRLLSDAVRIASFYVVNVSLSDHSLKHTCLNRLDIYLCSTIVRYLSTIVGH